MPLWLLTLPFLEIRFSMKLLYKGILFESQNQQQHSHDKVDLCLFYSMIEIHTYIQGLSIMMVRKFLLIALRIWLQITPLLSWPINKNFDQRTGILHIVRDPQGIPKIPFTRSESSILGRYSPLKWPFLQRQLQTSD